MMTLFVAGGLVNFSSDWAISSWQCLLCDALCLTRNKFTDHVRTHRQTPVSVTISVQNSKARVLQYGFIKNESHEAVSLSDVPSVNCTMVRNVPFVEADEISGENAKTTRDVPDTVGTNIACSAHTRAEQDTKYSGSTVVAATACGDNVTLDSIVKSLGICSDQHVSSGVCSDDRLTDTLDRANEVTSAVTILGEAAISEHTDVAETGLAKGQISSCCSDGVTIDNKDSNVEQVTELNGRPSTNVPRKSLKRKTLPKSSLLKNHVKKAKVQTNDQVYMCHICGWDSTKHFNYHRHMLKHFPSHASNSSAMADNEHIADFTEIRPAHEANMSLSENVSTSAEGLTISRNNPADNTASGTFTCPYCAKAISAHRGRCGYGGRRWACELCDAPPMFRSSYVLHQYRKHGGPKPLVYVCATCNYKSFKQSNYVQHCRRHHGVDVAGGTVGDRDRRKRACPKCDAPPMVPSSLVLHAYVMHGGPKPPEFTCPDCGYHSFKRSNFLAHVQRYRGDDGRCIKAKYASEESTRLVTDGSKRIYHKYFCSKCDFTTKRHDCLLRHMSSHESDSTKKPLMCDQCEYVAFDTTALRKHQLRHKRRDRRLRCVICALEVASVAAMRSHLVDDHGRSADYVCNVCGESFADDSAYWEHGRRHHDRTCVFVCALCGHTTADRNELNTHTTTAHGTTGGACHSALSESTDSTSMLPPVAPSTSRGADCYPCPQCDQSFGKLSMLTGHLRRQHGVAAGRPNDCVICGHVADSGAALRRHERETHSVQYVCDVCGLTMLRKWNLCRHKEQKHEQRVRQCAMCDYSSKSQLRLAKHYRGVHWVDAPPELQGVLNQPPRRNNNCTTRPLASVDKKMDEAVVCDICGKTIRRHFLKKHQESHERRRPFCCHHDTCSYSAPTTYALSQHLKRKHHAASNAPHAYSCMHCTYVTHEQARHVEHMRRVHSLECDVTVDCTGDAKQDQKASDVIVKVNDDRTTSPHEVPTSITISDESVTI